MQVRAVIDFKTKTTEYIITNRETGVVINSGTVEFRDPELTGITGIEVYTWSTGELCIDNIEITSNYEAHNSFCEESKTTVATFYECKNCPHRNNCKIEEKKYTLSLMERFYCSDLTKQFLKALFNSKATNDRVGYLDKVCFIYQKFLKDEDENSPNTYCFFVQLFRKARMEYGNLRDDIEWMTCTILRILTEREKASG